MKLQIIIVKIIKLKLTENIQGIYLYLGVVIGKSTESKK